MNRLTNQQIVSIRNENQSLIASSPTMKRAARYKKLAAKFGCCEWTARWICQGLQHQKVGGFIEPAQTRSYLGALNSSDAVSIRSRFDKGERMQDLAREYGVSVPTVKRLIKGLTYRNSAGPVSRGTVSTTQKQAPSGKKINSVDIFLILASYAVGKSVVEMAKMYNLSAETINNVLSDMKKTYARIF